MRVELNLPIERKWFDMIARGEKKEEYRDCEHRQVQRFYLWAGNCRWWSEYEPVVIFRNGYTMQSRALVARITGGDLRGRESVKHPEWGEPRCRRLHLVVQLGEILYKGTYAQVKEYIKQQRRPSKMPEYKKYIRCHIVKATPMTRGEYNKHRGWIAPANENAADEGYHVVYPDGYESWCPKAQFEAASSPDALYKVLEHFHNERYSDVAKRDETKLTHDLCLAYYKVFVTHSDQIDVKALLNRVHDFLGKLCRDGKCGEYCSACLEASDLADDVHDAIHKNVW